MGHGRNLNRAHAYALAVLERCYADVAAIPAVFWHTVLQLASIILPVISSFRILPFRHSVLCRARAPAARRHSAFLE
jgi:hypothetical protein